MASSRGIHTKDAAKMIRKVLKITYPGIKFSVTSKNSINIQWVDGPSTKAVDAALVGFKGKGFDGMTDSSYYNDSWLLTDGTVIPAKNGYTGDESPQPEGAELVHFYDYLFTKRIHSPAFVREVARQVNEDTLMDIPPIQEYDTYWSKSRNVQVGAFTDTRGDPNFDELAYRTYRDALYNTSAGERAKTQWGWAQHEPEPKSEPQVKIIQFPTPTNTDSNEFSISAS